MTDGARGRAHRALILAGGAGTRMQAGAGPGLAANQVAAAGRGEKAFMPLGERALIDYQIDVLDAAGFSDVCVVVPPGRTISGSYALAIQERPLGTANAVWSARGWAGDLPFLVLNGDNFYPADAIEAVAALDGAGLAGFDRDDLIATSNIPPEKINAFAVLETDGTARLRRIIEKPSAEEIRAMPTPILVSMNLWKFDARIFDACRDVAPSARGEFELPSAVMLARSRGVDFTVVPARGPVLDLSSRADISEVARRLGVPS